MLRIRDEQIAAFQAAIREDAHLVVTRYLRERMPDHVGALDDAALEQKVGAEIERARRHGIEVEWDLCRFVRFELLYGPRFDERCAWARAPLQKEGLSGTEKMNAVEQYHANYLK